MLLSLALSFRPTCLLEVGIDFLVLSELLEVIFLATDEAVESSLLLQGALNEIVGGTFEQALLLGNHLSGDWLGFSLEFLCNDAFVLQAFFETVDLFGELSRLLEEWLCQVGRMDFSAQLRQGFLNCLVS